LNRSYLATALGSYKNVGLEEPKKKGRKKSRPVKYGEGFVKVLVVILDEYGKPFGKLLVAIIRSIMDFLQESANPDHGITKGIKKLLLEVSANKADILLKPNRKALEIRRVSTMRTIQTPIRSQIHVRTYFEQDAVKHGKFALDTVGTAESLQAVGSARL
jgi:hypothetical protein